MNPLLKHYSSYSDIHNAIKNLSSAIIASNNIPDIIVAIGTGGLIPGRILKTFLKKTLLFVTVNLYDEVTDIAGNMPRKIQWINDMNQIKGKSIMVVDEVDDTRLTMEYVSNELYKWEPSQVSWLVVYNKIKEKRGKIPDFIKKVWVAYETNDIWIRFPWDAIDLVEHEELAKQERSLELKSYVEHSN